MSDFLPPVVAVLGSEIAGYLEGLARAQARMDTFIQAQSAALTEMEARFAKFGASTTELSAGMTEASAASERMATSTATSMSAVQAEIARSAESTKLLGTSAEQAAVQWETSLRAMEAETARLSTNMAVAEEKVAAGWKDVAVAEEAAAAKTAAATTPLGVSQKTLTNVSLAAAAVGYESIKMAGNFQAATTKLVTSGGEINSNLDMVRSGILTMTSQVGVGAEQLATDLYKINSAGYIGAEGLGVLKMAEQGARQEGASGTVVADALSTALRDYYPNAKGAAQVTADAGDVMSKFIAATSNGKMTFDQLASSLHSVAPLASAMHVPMSDILGDLASMTVHGMSADQATQNLSHTLQKLQGATPAMGKELALLGVNARQLSDDLSTKGLSGTVQELSKAIMNNLGPDKQHIVLDMMTALKGLPPQLQDLGRQAIDGTITMKDFTKAAKELGVEANGQVSSFATLAKSTHGLGSAQQNGQQVMQTYTQALKAALGDQTAMNTALMLTGDNAGYASKAVTAVGAAHRTASGDVQGFADVQNNFNFKLDQAKASMGSLVIEMGTKLLPVATSLIGVIGKLSDFLSKHQEICAVLARVIEGVLVVAFLGLALKAGRAFNNLAKDVAKFGADIIAKLFGMETAAQREAVVTESAAARVKLAYGEMATAAELSAGKIVAADAKAGAAAEGESLAGGAAKGGMIAKYGPAAALLGGAQALGSAIDSHNLAQVGGDQSKLGVAGGGLHDAVGILPALWSAVMDGNLDKTKTWWNDMYARNKDDIEHFGQRGALGALNDATKPTRSYQSVGDSAASGFENPKGDTSKTSGLDKLGLNLGQYARDALDATKSALAKARDIIEAPFKAGWHAVQDLFRMSPAQLGSAIGGAIGDLVGLMVRSGKRVWHGFWDDGVVPATHATIQWFHDLPENVQRWIGEAGHWLTQKGHDLWRGFWDDGVVPATRATIDWFKALPGNVQKWAGDTAHWLYQKGSDLWHGFWNGLGDAWNGFVAWWYSIPGKLKDGFNGSKDWLKSAGSDVMHGFWDGVTSFFGNIWSGISDFVSGFIGGFKSHFRSSSPSQAMHDVGADVIRGFADGVQNLMGSLGGIPRQVYDMINGPMSNANTWLFGAGRNIVTGLWNGISSLGSWIWNNVSAFASNIIHAANAAVGNKSPSTKMRQTGQWMVQGWALGIEDQAHLAINAARKLAGNVSNAMSGRGTFGTAGATGTTWVPSLSTTGNNGGGGDTHIHLNVAGSIWTMQDLMREVQQAFLQHGIRNGTSGINYSFA